MKNKLITKIILLLVMFVYLAEKKEEMKLLVKSHFASVLLKYKKNQLSELMKGLFE
jgi:hypothetical protein